MDQLRVMMAATDEMTALGESYNENIRPLLDAVDKLRNLKVTDEGVPLPTIVVVGDQSSGKSSVLDSLATIRLPRGQGISTRVPLIIRLQSCEPKDGSITISYGGVKPIVISESKIEAAVNEATNLLAGTAKGITNKPISLHIRKPLAPDLTMIDLPGITRVPVSGQPSNIYEQISAMIRHYIKPKETVILNVLSATVDFATCESIQMSQQEDKKGERTLAVVTKVDQAADGVYEKVLADDVKIGLGYICVSNRTEADRSHEEARERERRLFKLHPTLSQLDKEKVGIASLAEKLTRIQADIIRKSLPVIQQQVNKALRERRKELDTLLKISSFGEDPVGAFLHIVDNIKNLMEDIMLRGTYDHFANDPEMHYPPRLHSMFEAFSNRIHKVLDSIILESKTKELMERMQELQGITLPNFLSPTLMQSLVCEEIDRVSEVCADLVPNTHEYAKKFAFRIIEEVTSAFPKLQACYKQKVDNALMASQDCCTKYVQRTLDKERTTVFTMNDYYLENVNNIRVKLSEVKATYSRQTSFVGGSEQTVPVDGSQYQIYLREALKPGNDHQSAFDLKLNLYAYWKVIHKRMADEIPMEIRFSLQNSLLKDLRKRVLKSNMDSGDLSTLMEEDAAQLQKRTSLKNRIDILQECKDILQSLN